nr:hypothetical protein BaRGS_014209 [Batillaria attramentaria]
MKASELFLASGLNQDALKQIWELCGAKRLGQFGRSQFYIALKLIAVAQAGLPIKLETLNAGKDIPLPKFSAKSNDQGDKKKPVAEGDGSIGGGPGGGGGGGGGILNPAMTASGSDGVGGPHVNPVALQGGQYHNSSNENGNWAMFEDDESHSNGIKKWESSLEPPGMDSSSISSEAESVDDVWTITDEQREYYIKQFVSMQPDLNGVITVH